MTYDPLRCDAYAEHLCEVNTVKEVVASEDIRNDQGALLIQKGQKITSAVVDRIVKFKLLRPLESSVNISDALSGERLLQAIVDMSQGQPGLIQLQASAGFESLLKDCCGIYSGYDLLIQKLTVMSVQMPREYSKTLFVAWLSLVIADQMKLDAVAVRSVFLAALAHDIGMLHISRELLDKQDTLSAQEWKAICSHVVIGQKILEQIKGMPSSVGKAVLEHHERCDGTGYPRALFAPQLNVIGRIVSMADTVIAIYLNKLRPNGRGA
jgi:putative nucleotidyltransferase with HDIG domain